jgi:hypothetical protein
VASGSNDNDDRIEAPHEPRECMACRGTGRVISNLGGTAKSVTCPWCEGSGVRTPDVDAQARWLAEGTPSAATEPAEAETPAAADADSPGDSPDTAA